MTTPTRVPFWDNARFAAIVLVVFGHAVQRLTYDSDAAEALYLLVYAFHMPLFALVAGYFSSSAEPTRRRMARLFTDLIAPYLIFETLWTITQLLVTGRTDLDPAQPSWTLWFLLALALFRLVLPYLALLRAPVLWALAIAIVAGYLPGIDSTLSLSRFLGLLPFFTLGWWLRERDVVARRGLLDARPVWLRVVAVLVLAGAGAIAFAFVDVWRDVRLGTWFFFVDTYADLGAPQWWAGGVRLAIIALALVLMTAFLLLVPRRETSWTHLGRYTMSVYLLHTFVLYPFRQSGVLRGLEPAALWIPLIAVASVAIAVGLSSRPVRRLTRPLVEPRMPWLFRDRELGAGRGSR
ncbi:acyltransferase family protein [Microbacterium sp. CFBP 8790]|uniref:acyltransferase family protein n=1 Tax=unclassified Microbacterium TaxID=2609290 RepID=UPI00177A78F5|nr:MULTISPECIES: acyltransferase family protein [unclassified Microbacterium]MBD8205640.1 acyltransferase family protein [Microbacterium sp. CFBP 8801]MBD8508024.1 acyltransferase family protein [Microbacterium sp. CFBP 8790]